MTKKIDEDKTDAIVFFFTILIILFILSVVGLKSNTMEDKCYNEFVELSNQTPTSVFINNGGRYDCDVFWIEDGYTTHVIFNYGELNKEHINREKYWKRFQIIRLK